MSNWINYNPQKSNRRYRQYQYATDNNNINTYQGYNDYLYARNQAQSWTNTENPQNDYCDYNYQYQRHNNYYQNEMGNNKKPFVDYTYKNCNLKESTHFKKYYAHDCQDENDKNNQVKGGTVSKKNFIKKRRKINKTALNEDNNISEYNRNNLNELNLEKNNLPREEVLRVKIQLKENKFEEIIVHKNDEPFQIAKNFVEVNELSHQLIHPLAIQLSMTLLVINQVLNRKLSQDNIAVLRKLESISEQKLKE